MTRRAALPAPNATLVRPSAAPLSPREPGEALARVRFCRSHWERLRGLIGYAPLPPGLGLALPQCGAIHTAFVRAPIDVLFLRAGRVVGIAAGVRPWRIARASGAQVTVELAAGSVAQLSICLGEKLDVRLD